MRSEATRALNRRAPLIVETTLGRPVGAVSISACSWKQNTLGILNRKNLRQEVGSNSDGRIRAVKREG